ncbi:LysR family transcriptional regulator [uncultured Tateyamaria sp.]|uniref:LysR family transcriptional regulator n=1 Tax=uncultured Tateyamaria sp. TaxID=455651 RepID=UPI00261C5615|nr:LysR family transcriptional regulator [uncultured Tateyamaria sp.]
MRSNIDLNLLVVFDTVMTERNLRAAGEKLNRSQPAVSQAVARLRDLTGDRLFDRSPTGIIPTPRAEVLWAEVRDPLALLQRTLSTLKFDPAKISGEIVFGVSDDIRILHWPRLAEAILLQAPNVTLRMVETNHTSVWPQLRDGTFDVALTVAGQPPAGMGARIFNQDDFVLLHRKDRKAPKTAKAYADCRQLALVFDEEQPAYADEALEAAGEARHVIVRTTRFDALPPMVAELDAVVALPRSIATRFAETFGLSTSPLPLPFPTAIQKICWNQKTRNDPQNKWLRALLSDVLNEACAVP